MNKIIIKVNKIKAITMNIKEITTFKVIQINFSNDNNTISIL